MGYEKRYHYLQRMIFLSSNRVSNDFLKTMFFEHLPGRVKNILAVCESSDNEKLAFQADKIAEAF